MTEHKEHPECPTCGDKGWYAADFAPSGIPGDWAYCHCRIGKRLVVEHGCDTQPT